MSSIPDAPHSRLQSFCIAAIIDLALKCKVKPKPVRSGTDDSLRKVKFIRAAQGIGFTLDDIRQLLAAEDGHTPRCCDVQPLLNERLADVEQRLRDLQEVKRVLQSALRKCRRGKPNDPCEVIVTIRNS